MMREFATTQPWNTEIPTSTSSPVSGPDQFRKRQTWNKFGLAASHFEANDSAHARRGPASKAQTSHSPQNKTGLVVLHSCDHRGGACGGPFLAHVQPALCESTLTGSRQQTWVWGQEIAPRFRSNDSIARSISKSASGLVTRSSSVHAASSRFKSPGSFAA